MKNLIQYLKLWQKKRNELRIDADADTDWLEMHALLDKHIPDNDNTDGSSGKRGINLLTTMLITLSAAAAIYVTTQVVRTQIQAYHHKNSIHHKKHGFNNGTDSLSVADSSQQEPDSATNETKISEADNNNPDSASNATVNKLKNTTDSIAEKTNSASMAGTASVKAKSLDKNNVTVNGSNTKSGNPLPSDNKPQRLNDVHTGAKNAANSIGKNNVIVNGSNTKPGNAVPANNKPQRLSNVHTGAKNVANNTGKNNVASNKRRTRSGNASSSDGEKMPPNRTYPGTRDASDKNHGSHQTRNIKDDIKPKDNTSTADDQNNNRLAFLAQPRHSFIPNPHKIESYLIPNNYGIHRAGTTSAGKNQKNKPSNTGNGTLEWGILIGANSNGSFTAKNVNSNFYGSLPVDIFPGLYVTYNIKSKWGIGTQIMVLSPVIAKGGTYTRPYLNYTDSITTLKFKNITDSKKVYSVQLPIYAVYHYNKNIDFKAGSVISFPVKQFNTTTQIDSVSRVILTTSHYDQKTDFSALAGINYRYKMIIFEVSYLKGLKSHTIAVSDSLIHKATNNTFQFTIKLQLGGNKK